MVDNFSFFEETLALAFLHNIKLGPNSVFLWNFEANLKASEIPEIRALSPSEKFGRSLDGKKEIRVFSKFQTAVGVSGNASGIKTNQSKS